MTIKAIFFDLDDTLHDHLYPFSKAFKDTFPLLYEYMDVTSLYKKFRDFSDLLWKQYSSRQLTLEEMRIARIVMALEYFQKGITNELASRFQAQYELNSGSLQLFAEVPKLINEIKAQGKLVGIITNGPVQHQFNKINSLGLTSFVSRDRIFISDEVGVAKPNKQIFQHVAQKVNMIPSEMIYIGDSWPNDVVAPMEAGWKAIWYNHRKRLPDIGHKPLAEINQLLSIIDIVKEES
ncbi:putative hydrolase of the HAD superfamily [Bacillus niacini]|uniref:Hydrolase of the HAD superfamily n=1 Tax=Neobacillus niacini TaxID=86668 RepID=A0A852TLT0_9BACI|nr:HAD family hydrolase [Neobacillus niacini]NYE09111.1 putative hydrolase of the HAD superfamily [Neobacillus niacini]